MEKQLNELVEKLKAAGRTNLKSVVLYGSAAAGEFHPEFSDLNVIAIVDRLGAADLERLRPAGEWWARKGHPAPLVFSHEAMRRSADVFAMELLDIKANRRVLYGEDVFANLDVPMELHRIELERELRTNLVRLRQSYLAGPDKPKRLLALMTASISTFIVLFRHALLALGERVPERRREVVEKLAGLLGFDRAAFDTVLDVREGKRKPKHVDASSTFRAYLEGVARVAEEMDRRLAP